MKCEYCGKQIQDNVSKCPYCNGSVINSSTVSVQLQSKKQSNTSPIIIAAIVVFIVSLIVIPSVISTHNNETQQNNNIIESTQSNLTAEKDIQADTTTAKKENDKWTIKNYVDEFDNPTYEKYITNMNYIYGVFGNSATTDSDLKVQLLIDNDSFSIKLYEYGDNLVKNSNSYSKKTDDYTISVLDKDNIKHKMEGKIYVGNDRINIVDTDMKTLIRIFRENGKVSFYIQETERPVCYYKFSLDTIGFDEIYKEYKS